MLASAWVPFCTRARATPSAIAAAVAGFPERAVIEIIGASGEVAAATPALSTAGDTRAQTAASPARATSVATRP
ncbi:hypothetical protein ACFV08_20765 [Streptomyces fradiae]|uniref:hypothetical protein n=1 Tax=Streptomyces fradiae TaxID=1906 RepID=UPI0036857F42